MNRPNDEAIRYRVALMRHHPMLPHLPARASYPRLVEPNDYAQTEAGELFIRWLGDEQEVEVAK